MYIVDDLLHPLSSHVIRPVILSMPKSEDTTNSSGAPIATGKGIFGFLMVEQGQALRFPGKIVLALAVVFFRKTLHYLNPTFSGL